MLAFSGECPSLPCTLACTLLFVAGTDAIICPSQVSRSLVVDAATGASKTDDIRTSFGAAFGWVH